MPSSPVPAEMQKEEGPSPEHLQSGAHAELPRQIEVAAGDRAPGPEETAQQQDQRRGAEAAVMKARGNHEHNDPRNAQHDAGQRLCIRPLPTGKPPLRQQDPDRNGGGDHRCQARRHFLLRPEKAAVIAGKHDQAEYRGTHPLPPGWAAASRASGCSRRELRRRTGIESKPQRRAASPQPPAEWPGTTHPKRSRWRRRRAACGWP